MAITYTLSFNDNWIDLDQHDCGKVTTIARFNPHEVSPERARRLAVMLLGEAVIITDALAATIGNQEKDAVFEGWWLAETFIGLKAESEHTKLKAVLEAAESTAYDWITAGFTTDSDLTVTVTGWQTDPDQDREEYQYLVKVDLIDPEGGRSSEVFLVLPNDAGGWDGEYCCEAELFEPESWQPLPAEAKE
jgi:hypothetical protein